MMPLYFYPDFQVSGPGGFAAFIEKSWYQRSVWLYLFWPLSILFSLCIFIRRTLYTLYKRNSVKPLSNVPVVVVGNLTVGGSGKTPLLLALAKELQRRGHRVGIVSRGYGAKSIHFPMWVKENTPASLCGDEPAMLARKLSVPVVVDPLRRRAVALLESEQQYLCDVILSDDGLQHYPMRRDIEIVVVDGARGFGNNLCLPAGPLREPLSRLKSVNFVVSNGRDQTGALMGVKDVAIMALKPIACINLKSGEKLKPQDFFDRQKMVHAVAGIGNPSRFFQLVKNFGVQVIEHPFPDHHPYQQSDLKFGDTLAVIMTEKDAVKCAEFNVANVWYIEVEAELPTVFFEQLVNRIASLQIARKIGVQRNLFDA